MTQAWSSKSFHQVFYAWTEANRGHAISASSLPQHEVPMWNSRLGNLVRLQPVQGFDLPGSALSYQEFGDGLSAVLRRTETGYSTGRNNAHVLIGDATVLDFELALDLANWPGWQTEMPLTTEMELLDPRKVESEAGSRDWRRAAERLEDAAAAILSEVLKNPAAPLSVIGCPEADRLPLLWALREAGNRPLKAREQVWRWSFSTYEDRHDDVKYLPEIVFLPKLPFGGTRRTVFDFGKQYVISSAARHLVGQLFRGTAAPETYEAPRRDHVPVQQAQPHHEPERVTGKSVATKLPRRLHELAEQVRQVSDAVSLLAVLDLISGLAPAHREQLFGLLTVADVNKVTKFAEFVVPGELHRKVLHSFLGPDLQGLRENPAAQKQLLDIVRTGDSLYFPRIVALEALRTGCQEVANASVNRVLESPVPPGRDSFGPAGRTWRRMSKSRKVSVTLVTALVVAAALVGFGFWLAPPSHQANAAPQTTTTTTEQPTTPQPPQPGLVSVQPSVSRVVYSFVVVGASYYPQQQCTPANEPGTLWQCTRTGNPAPRNGVLTAVVVPRTELDRLAQASDGGGAVERRQDWGDPMPVPVG